ncbi:MAG TPA: response regulator [Burkholderiales bacterium]|nr:response regulator [Burkholderiales bacterium]
MVPALEEERRRPLRVLVVDDNIDHVRTMAYLVRDSGHHVDYAINGIVALELAQRTRPDVVILDVFLPDTNGFELARELRKNPQLKQAYVVGITGRDVERAVAMQNGFDELLHKPVHFRLIDELLSRIFRK